MGNLRGLGRICLALALLSAFAFPCAAAAKSCACAMPDAAYYEKLRALCKGDDCCEASVAKMKRDQGVLPNDLTMQKAACSNDQVPCFAPAPFMARITKTCPKDWATAKLRCGDSSYRWCEERVKCLYNDEGRTDICR